MELSPAEKELLSQALFLARRTMHLAYFWNDHNFPPAHEMAQEECERQAIRNEAEAQVTLGKMQFLHQRLVHEKS